MKHPDTVSVLFVCLGNICRSPLAEGVFRAEVNARGIANAFTVDSCGTGSWHVGEKPDARSAEVALAHGFDIRQQRARQLAPRDFDDFHWMIVMDRSNESTVCRQKPSQSQTQIRRFMTFVENPPGSDVPDPYYGGEDGFETVYRLLKRGAGPLLDHLLHQNETKA
jgi:protein-tyrosine phosphatase